MARWNGSILYPAKVPDLIGFKDRMFIDHTGTHRHRNIGDLMRYAALVSFADATDFGPHTVADAGTKRFGRRLSDEALYAMALYIYSLQPPSNPHPFDDAARAGQAVFARRLHNMPQQPRSTKHQATPPWARASPATEPSVLPISVAPIRLAYARARHRHYKVRRSSLLIRGHTSRRAVATLEDVRRQPLSDDTSPV